VELGELAPEHDRRVAPGFRKRVEGLHDAERRLEEHGRPGARGMCRVPAVPFPPPWRRKPEEDERDGGKPRERQDREDGGRSGDRFHLMPGRGRGRDEPLPGIRDDGRSGVRHESNRLPAGQSLEGLADAMVLVVAVAGHTGCREREPREEVPRAARILAVDDVRRRESLPRPRRQVVEIADRRGDDEEAAHPPHSLAISPRGPCYDPGVFRGSLVALTLAGGILSGAARGTAAETAVPAPPSPPPSTTPSGPAVLVDRIAAVVGDDLILEGEVRKLVDVRYLERKPGESDVSYRDRVLDQRIVDLLREKQLRRSSGFDPKPEEVEARVAALEERLARDRGVSAATALAAAGTTREELASWVRRGLALDSFVKERLTPGLKLTESDLRAYYDTTFRDAAKKRGLPTLPPFDDVREEIREVVRELRLNAEILRWTEQLRSETRILIYRR
jgi:hypothetical protein